MITNKTKMKNPTKEQLLMENIILRKILFPCKTCKGIGTLDDLEPGDIGGTTWECPDCHGFNANKAKKELSKAYDHPM